jgi:hypothetical protein
MKRALIILLLAGIFVSLGYIAWHEHAHAHDLSDANTADYALRGFLGVRTINCEYQFSPSDHHAFQLTALRFEDGKVIEKGGGTFGKIDTLPSHKLKMEFMWGDVNGKPHTTLIMPGMSAGSPDPFWQKLDGGWASLPNDLAQHYNDYLILGFAQSNLGRDGSTNNAFGADFPDALKSQKYVGAIALKLFDTVDQAQNAFSSK